MIKVHSAMMLLSVQKEQRCSLRAFPTFLPSPSL